MFLNVIFIIKDSMNRPWKQIYSKKWVMLFKLVTVTLLCFNKYLQLLWQVHYFILKNESMHLKTWNKNKMQEKNNSKISILKEFGCEITVNTTTSVRWLKCYQLTKDSTYNVKLVNLSTVCSKKWNKEIIHLKFWQ